MLPFPSVYLYRVSPVNIRVNNSKSKLVVKICWLNLKLYDRIFYPLHQQVLQVYVHMLLGGFEATYSRKFILLKGIYRLNFPGLRSNVNF